MNKPKMVSKNAIWDEDEYEWQLGERNKEGQEVGDWIYWTPEGHPSCVATFDSSGNVIEHEHFPRSGFAEVWSCRRRDDFGGYDFYDKEGRLQSLGPSIRKYEKGSIGETAEQAIKRFEETIAAIKQCDIVDHEYLDEINFFEVHKIHCHQTVTEGELEEYEDKLNLIFPPSYKRFVLQYGLLIFGAENENNRKMILDFERMSDALNDYWNMDIEKEFSQDAQNRLKKIIAFSYGDEGLQLQWYHCFDFNTLNSKSGEVDVVDFDQDDSYGLAHGSEEPCKSNGFDDHMRKIVDNHIGYVLDLIEHEGVEEY